MHMHMCKPPESHDIHNYMHMHMYMHTCVVSHEISLEGAELLHTLLTYLPTYLRYAHGAFVYEMRGSEPIFFQLLEHSAEQLAEFDDKTRAPEVNGREHHSSLMRRQVTKGVSVFAREEKEMERITNHAALGFGGRKLRLTWLRILAVYFGALPIVIPLMALAYLHEGIFETVSKLVFFSSLVFVAWVPLRDTAALSVLAHSKARVRRFNALQVYILPRGVYTYTHTHTYAYPVRRFTALQMCA